MSEFVYRLGVDLGTNSLGWCLITLDKKGVPCGILNAGSRIFSDDRDPQTGTSLAVERRIARGTRRRRERSHFHIPPGSYNHCVSFVSI